MGKKWDTFIRKKADMSSQERKIRRLIGLGVVVVVVILALLYAPR
jgi:hypothetical protein